MRRSAFPIALCHALVPSAMVAQNLIANAGFEQYTSLPTAAAQPCHSVGWTTPAGTCIPSVPPGCGSPDYYHSLSATAGLSPTVMQFGSCNPHSGQAMMGVGPFQQVNASYREYVSRALTAPLVVGNQYEVGMWMSNGITSFYNGGTNHNGFVFSTAPLAQNCGLPIITTPTVEFPGVIYSTGWVYVSAVFTATQPSTYMCFGNFAPFAATTCQMFGGGPALSYYYIDDMSVAPVGVLPIELIGFKASSPDGRTALLEWSTATETDNVRFAVERSSDMTVWSVAGELPGAFNSSSIQQYKLVDAQPHQGINYYRLRQFDADGSSSLSDVVPLTMAGVGPMLLSCTPQPAVAEVNIAWGDTDIDAATLIVSDALGKVVLSQPVTDRANGSMFCNVEHLASGIYAVSLLAHGTPIGIGKMVKE